MGVQLCGIPMADRPRAQSGEAVAETRDMGDTNKEPAHIEPARTAALLLPISKADPPHTETTRDLHHLREMTRTPTAGAELPPRISLLMAVTHNRADSMTDTTVLPKIADTSTTLPRIPYISRGLRALQIMRDLERPGKASIRTCHSLAKINRPADPPDTLRNPADGVLSKLCNHHSR
jgi:hypothetical protein